MFSHCYAFYGGFSLLCARFMFKFILVFFTDVRAALIGVGVIIKGEKTGIEILDKGEENM